MESQESLSACAILSRGHFITNARLPLQANPSSERTLFTFRYADPN
jgi:hypothetical protein